MVCHEAVTRVLRTNPRVLGNRNGASLSHSVSCVTLDKFLDFSEPLCSLLRKLGVLICFARGREERQL